MPGDRARVRYPPAARDDVAEPVGDRLIPDPYRWLEDAGTERSRQWLARQAAWYEQAHGTWAHRPAFLAALDRLTGFDLLSAPVWAGGLAFSTCRPAGAQHTTLLVDDAGTVRTLVDPHRLDPSGRTVLGSWSPSPDGTLVAYQVAVGGAEEFELYVQEVATGRQVEGPLDGCRYSAVAWLPQSSPAFCVVRRVAGRLGVYRHAVATGEPDRLVFGAGYPDTAEFEVSVAPDGSRLVVLAWTGMAAANEVWHAELDDQQPPAFHRLGVLRDGWNSVWPGHRGELYLLTDEQAPRGRVVRVATAACDPGAGTAAGLVDEDPEAVLDGFAVLDGDELDPALILVLSSVDGRSRLRRHELATGRLVGEVSLPGAGVVSELTCRPDEGRSAWYVYSDPRTPETVYHYDARTDRSRVWRQAPAVGVPEVRIDQRSYRSSDGTAVRLTVLHPPGPVAGLPTILQGYGAFGRSQPVDFYAAALSWVEQGGAFALAAVRGGGEGGESWHQAGMGERKQQGIEDFLAAAQHLVELGVTEPARLGAFGQSAGGLLVSAAMTQRPDLFGAVAATAGLHDMARYELSGMGAHWTEEFGSRTDPVELGWLLGYSPYHRLRPGTEYPAVLLSAQASDTRVDPLHSRKMCAALQHATASEPGSRPVLLNYEYDAGHGERSRNERLGYFADVLAFFGHHLGLGSGLNRRTAGAAIAAPRCSG